MKKAISLAIFILLTSIALLAGCESQDYSGNISDDSCEEEGTAMRMEVNINGTGFMATLEDNDAANALVGMLRDGSLTIRLRDYGGFEKAGSLGRSLPSSNRQITAHAGDIVLYQGNQIVMFYGSNSWSYTMLGHIEDLTGWEEALGRGEITATLSLER